MAEGFLQPDDGSGDVESVGEKFINILLHSSLLQVLWRDDDRNVEMCSMHDHVHDLACSVLGTSNRAGGRSRARCMILNYESSSIDRGEMKYFRTLLIKSSDISGIMFSHFESLHVLTLEYCPVEELPSSIKKLIHLRKLNISDSRIKSLPDWIGELHYLQTLRAEYYDLKKLPSTIKYLTNMRHLYLDRDTVLPAGIGVLTCLQTIRYFGVGDENDGCKIEELGSLNDLKGKLQIRNLERVRDKEEAAKANLFRKSKIMELDLSWDGRREGEIENDENVLEGLEPHGDLKKLSIWGFKGKRFPPWFVKMVVRDGAGGSWMVLSKLIEISLQGCSECEEIPMLGHLPNLKTLTLQGLSNVKHINSSAYGFANRDARIVFPALETLVLHDMPKLARVESDCGSDDVQVLPRLQSLEIQKCPQLMSVGTHSLPCLKYLSIGNWMSSMPAANLLFKTKYGLLAELFLVGIDDLECLPDWLFNENPNLSTLWMNHCPKLREVAPGLLTLTSSLQKLHIEHCPLLECLPDVLFNENPNLSKLMMKECPKLREVPPGLLSLNSSLEELKITSCPLLERITGVDGGEESQSVGSSFFSFTSLRIIRIEGCDALVWLPCELVGPSLEQLYLVSLRSLKNLPSLMALIDCMARSSRLRFLKVVEVPKFMATGSPVEGWRFGSLIRIESDASVEGSMETVDGILQGCHHSLTNLEMKGMEYWDGLPESIQCLTALHLLYLVNLGMEELPEWFGNLSSLEMLYMRDCKRLRRLPSMDAMSRLQQFEYLEISGCPELLAQGVADREWPKVSHISTVTVDGTRLDAGSDTSRVSRWRKLKCLG